jgi:N-acetylmuramoyl-L-alanine amidase
MDRTMDNWIDTRTEEQKESLKKLLKELKQKYPEAKIYGHNDFTNKKVCPCFDAKQEYKNIDNGIRQ